MTKDEILVAYSLCTRPLDSILRAKAKEPVEITSKYSFQDAGESLSGSLHWRLERESSCQARALVDVSEPF